MADSLFVSEDEPDSGATSQIPGSCGERMAAYPHHPLLKCNHIIITTEGSALCGSNCVGVSTGPVPGMIGQAFESRACSKMNPALVPNRRVRSVLNHWVKGITGDEQLDEKAKAGTNPPSAKDSTRTARQTAEGALNMGVHDPQSSSSNSLEPSGTIQEQSPLLKNIVSHLRAQRVSISPRIAATVPNPASRFSNDHANSFTQQGMSQSEKDKADVKKCMAKYEEMRKMKPEDREKLQVIHNGDWERRNTTRAQYDTAIKLAKVHVSAVNADEDTEMGSTEDVDNINNDEPNCKRRRVQNASIFASSEHPTDTSDPHAFTGRNMAKSADMVSVPEEVLDNKVTASDSFSMRSATTYGHDEIEAGSMTPLPAYADCDDDQADFHRLPTVNEEGDEEADLGFEKYMDVGAASYAAAERKRKRKL